MLRAARLILGFALAVNAAAWGQAAAPDETLTLSQAVKIALEKNPMRKAALADTRAAEAGKREARSALLPRLTFSETATRGNDPVYVFGSRLRQQRFTQADFALNQLNTPTPLGNFATRFGGSWSLFDSMASWRRVEQAQQMSEASLHQLERTGQETIYRVVEAYYGVLLAEKQLGVAEQAVMTAQAVLDRSQARFDSGLVVESDLLSAKVRRSSREQELIRSRNNLLLAKAQLNILMGVPAETPYSLSEASGEATGAMAGLPELEKTALESRPDLKRIRAEESAQRLSVMIAKSSFGPRLNAFGSWQLDNPTFLAGGGGNNWVGGIELQLDLFTGGAKRAQLSRERAVADRVAAMKQAAEDSVRLEVRRAYYDTDSARQQLGVARGAADQATESLRINQNRYEGGLATISDLLGAEETARRSRAEYWEALYRLWTSYAGLQLATGTLNPQSDVVKP
jgi:outer membrane protein